MSEFVLVYWTEPSLKEAREVVSGLVNGKQIACGTLIPKVESIFEWNGEVQSAEEVLVMMKTRNELFEDVKKYIEINASYDVPEILKVSIQKESELYLKLAGQLLFNKYFNVLK